MEFFLNPWFMAAGGVMVSSPIIIHLINRMRFKRLRWAAMEFLLKSQKRNRRRIIIEQLILLALRILLVLLVALLVARWVYGSGNSSSGVMHVVVVDDTLSMRDHWHDDQGDHTAWSSAREQVMRLAKSAQLANATQEMKVFLLSDLEHPIFEGKLNEQSEAVIGDELDKHKPTYLHISPLKGLETGHKLLRSAVQGQRILHFVSDFRDSDWDTGAEARNILEEKNGIIEDQINLSLIDTADPSRSQNRGVAKGHDCVAILDLKPNRRIALDGADVDFTAVICNYGMAPSPKLEFSVLIDGKEDFRGRTTLMPLQPSQRLEHKFTLSFQKVKNGREFAKVRAIVKEAGSPSPLEAVEVRDVVVDVRSKIPILIVDGRGKLIKDLEADIIRSMQSQEDKGDLDKIRAKLESKDYYPQFSESDYRVLECGLDAGKVYEPEQTTVADLGKRLAPDNKNERLQLNDYPTIYMLDVPPIKNELVLDKLQQFVENGGNLVWFLGPKTQASALNELHAQRHGLFPVLLDPKPVDLLGLLIEKQERTAALDNWIRKYERKEPTDEARRRLMRRIWVEGWDPEADKSSAQPIVQAKFLFRDPTHPFIAKESYGLAYLAPGWFTNLLIGYYFRPNEDTNLWNPEVLPSEVKQVISMPQIRSTTSDFQENVQKIVQQVLETTAPKEADPNSKNADSADEFKDYHKALTAYERRIKNALEAHSMAMLDLALDHFLEDTVDKKDPSRPDMPKFWANNKLRPLKAKLVALRDRIRYGDPLVLTRQYRSKDGKLGGHTVAILTTAGGARGGSAESPNLLNGPRWSEWSTGPALPTWSNFIRPMQAYLDTQGDRYNHVLSADPKAAVELEVPNIYKDEITVKFMPQEQPKAKAGQVAPPVAINDLPVRRLEKKGDRLLLSFAEAREPGVYSFTLSPTRAGGEADVVSLAYNVDAVNEGNLSRVAGDKLERKVEKNSRKGKVMLISAGDDFARFKNQEPDWSEQPWIYLVFLLLLVAEQAMAVHLSFHLKGSDIGAVPMRAAA